MNFKRILSISLKLFCLGIVFIILANIWVKSKSSFTFDTISNVPKNKVGLVLGTVKTLQNGRENLYFKYRIDAALKLYKAGKVDFLILSGDNSRKEYDEPSDMKSDLMKNGVPESKIFLDYAGFRTLDSVVRAKAIFGQDKITIISQQFHNERAICIAQNKGIDAIGFNAQSVSRRYGIKVQIREIAARAKMLIDLIIGVQPKFLGKKIKIE